MQDIWSPPLRVHTYYQKSSNCVNSLKDSSPLSISTLNSNPARPSTPLCTTWYMGSTPSCDHHNRSPPLPTEMNNRNCNKLWLKMNVPSILPTYSTHHSMTDHAFNWLRLVQGQSLTRDLNYVHTFMPKKQQLLHSPEISIKSLAKPFHCKWS